MIDLNEGALKCDQCRKVIVHHKGFEKTENSPGKGWVERELAIEARIVGTYIENVEQPSMGKILCTRCRW